MTKGKGKRELKPIERREGSGPKQELLREISSLMERDTVWYTAEDWTDRMDDGRLRRNRQETRDKRAEEEGRGGDVDAGCGMWDVLVSDAVSQRPGCCVRKKLLSTQDGSILYRGHGIASKARLQLNHGPSNTTRTTYGHFHPTSICVLYLMTPIATHSQLNLFLLPRSRKVYSIGWDG